MATRMRKIDELAETLGDLSVTVDELKDDPDGIDEGKLNQIKAALDKATAVVDEIENESGRLIP
jgi:outer membrane murein-binding lipoprotein Lpp